MLSVVTLLPLISVVLASQHIFWDGVGLPHPSLWNRTCDGEDFALVASGHPVCLKPRNATTKPVPVIKPGPLPYGPWTEVSDCLQNAKGSNVYCIFTSTTFANNRGISVFTTPAVAEHMSQQIAFTTPKVLDGVNFMSSPPYNVQPLPGRGLGVIANSTLFRGDKVMSYTPVLIVNRQTLEEFQNKDRFAFQRKAVERLPSHTRDLVYSMHANFGDEDVLEDIIDTNSFQVPYGEDNQAHAVLLPEPARMNHDCRPNVQYYFDPYTLTQHSHALRTIQPGEELTDTYTDITVSRAERQAAIKHSWGFDCACSLCRQPEIFTRESDRRLKLIGELEKQLNDWSRESKATPEMAETLLSLYEQERMDGLIARAYTMAALMNSSVGKEQAAIRYAALAVERNTLNFGPHWGDVRFMRELMEDPTHHWSWKLRIPKET